MESSDKWEGTARKNQDLLTLPFPHKKITPYNKEWWGINYAYEVLNAGVSSAVFPEQGCDIWAPYRVQEMREDDGSSQFRVRPEDAGAFLLPSSS